MKNIKTYITESKKFEDADEFLGYIVKTAKGNPKIYDDTESWVANDVFDYWQDVKGKYDDVKDFISEYCDRKRVAGWVTKESFEETEKMIPKLLKDIMKKSKPEMPYKKHSNKFEVWETTQNNYDINVLKFKNYANDNGTDYAEYWYMITVE